MPQFQLVTQAPLVAFVGIFFMLGGLILLLFGLGIVQSGTGQDIMFRIKSGRSTTVIGVAGILLGGAGILWSVIASRPDVPVQATPTQPPEAATTAPEPIADTDPSIYDNFNDTQYDGSLNPDLWDEPGVTPPDFVEQQSGELVLSLEPGAGKHAIVVTRKQLLAGEPQFAEAKLLLSGERPGEEGDGGFGISTEVGGEHLMFGCLIYRGQPSVGCEVLGRGDSSEYHSKAVATEYDTWHTVRLEMDSEMYVTFYVDSQPVGVYRPEDAGDMMGAVFRPEVAVYDPKQQGHRIRVDDVRFGWLDE